MKFLDCFNKIQKGNYALTDEAIYSSIQNGNELIPLYGGNKSHKATERKVSISAKTKNGIPITVFSGEGIIISLDGSAGSMTYKNNEKFALNHHAGFITLKKMDEKIVSLEYFSMFFQNHYRSLSISEGSKTLSLEQIYSEDIDFPPYCVQIEIVKAIKPCLNKLNILIQNRKKYNLILNKELSITYDLYQAKDVPISNCIGYISGNSGLTEEFIYHTLQFSGTNYIVLSSATEDRTMMGKIPYCKIGNKNLKVFENKPGLLVTRNGKAGMTRYLEQGKYTINDHAYILFILDNCPYNIDLRWLAIQYRSTFLEYSSSSDNGTWNMTGFFKHARIDIPKNSEQMKIVALYEKLEKRIASIDDIEGKFNKLTSKEISIA